MKIVGIDPGVSGGLAFLKNNKLIGTSVMPIYKYTVGQGKKKKNKYTVDCKIVADLFREFKPDVVYMEEVHSMPGQGVVSMFSFGRTVGRVEGVCETLGLPYKQVRPQEWKKVILTDTDKDKQAAIDFCYYNFDNVDLKATKRCKKDHDGMADAICIAVYGMRAEIINNRQRGEN